MIRKRLSEIRKKNKACTFFISMAIISLICLSCNTRETYMHYKNIDDSLWSKNDTLYFEIDSSLIEPGIPYAISIEVVNNAAYPYRNIWFYTWDNFKDTIFEAAEKQYMMADEYGKWYGSGFGALYQLSFLYNEPISFKEKRNYLIKLVHGMRDEPLEGIEKVGLKIKEAASIK